jgi:hypothetical protein
LFLLREAQALANAMKANAAVCLCLYDKGIGNIEKQFCHSQRCFLHASAFATSATIG